MAILAATKGHPLHIDLKRFTARPIVVCISESRSSSRLTSLLGPGYPKQ
jgi:hypothetical protein